MGRRLHTTLLVTLVITVVISSFALPSLANSQPASQYPPVVIDVWPIPGTEMLGQEPLSITFDQPMDKPSTEAALQFDPPLQGIISWIDAQTLVFTPREGWIPEMTYSVTVTLATMAASGTKIESPYEFAVRTLGVLTIGQAIPAPDATEVELSTPIIVSFNRPMYALGEQGKVLSLAIEPAVVGSGEWVSDTIYRFTPLKPLEINTTYTISVNPIASVDGARLKEAYTWQFTTLPPKVLAASIYPVTDDDRKPGLSYYSDWVPDLDNVAPDKGIEVRFTNQVDQASVEASFSLVGDGQTVAGTFRWQWAKDVLIMRFDPIPLLKMDTDYHVTFTAAARSSGGLMGEPTTFDFHTIPYPATVSTSPSNGATNIRFPHDRVTLRFNSTRINDKSLMDHLVISPAPAKPPRLSSYYQYATLDFAVTPNTTYTITIEAGVTDTFGNSIKTPYTFSFTTGEEVVTIRSESYSDAPDWRFTVPLNADLMITSAKRAPTTFAVNFSKPLKLPIQLYRITSSEVSAADLHTHNSLSFYSATSSAYYDNTGRCQPPPFVKPNNQIRAWNELLYEEDHSQEVSLSTSSEEPLPLGIYWITMGDRTQACVQRATYEGEDTYEYGPEWQFGLAVVTANITLKRGPQDVLVWVTDLETTAPIANAKVTIYDDGQVLASGVTNLDGVAQLPALEKVHKQIVVVAESKDVFAIWHDYWTTGDRHPVDPTLGYDYDSTIYISSPIESRGYLYTDRPIYRPGDTVYFRGVIRDKSDMSYPLPATRDIYVRAGRMWGDGGVPQPFYEVKLELNEYGTFSSSFKIPEDVQTNDGALDLWATFNKDLMVDRYGYSVVASGAAISFNVAEYRTPEFEVKVLPDQQVAVKGDQISATVQASYYFGGGVSNSPIQWNTYSTWGSYNYTGPGNWQFGYASPYNSYDQWSSWDNLYPDDSGDERYGYYYSTALRKGTAMTDQYGRAAIDTVAELPDSRYSYTQTLIFEASILDESKMSVSGRGSMVVYPSSMFVGVRLNGRPHYGQPYTVEFITVSPDSKPRSDRPIDIKLEGYLWNRSSWGIWKNIFDTTARPEWSSSVYLQRFTTGRLLYDRLRRR